MMKYNLNLNLGVSVRKEIVGWPQYEITDDGRVFSKKRGKFLTPIKHSKGYLRVKLGVLRQDIYTGL
jgi:hypothetical protein